MNVSSSPEQPQRVHVRSAWEAEPAAPFRVAAAGPEAGLPPMWGKNQHWTQFLCCSGPAPNVSRPNHSGSHRTTKTQQMWKLLQREQRRKWLPENHGWAHAEDAQRVQHTEDALVSCPGSGPGPGPGSGPGPDSGPGHAHSDFPSSRAGQGLGPDVVLLSRSRSYHASALAAVSRLATLALAFLSACLTSASLLVCSFFFWLQMNELNFLRRPSGLYCV